VTPIEEVNLLTGADLDAYRKLAELNQQLSHAFDVVRAMCVVGSQMDSITFVFCKLFLFYA